MNILQINTLDHRGGAARVAGTLGQALSAQGVEVTFLVKQKSSSSAAVKELPPSILSRALAKFLANDLAFFSKKKVLTSLEYLAAQLVHCHNLHGGYFNLDVFPEMSKSKPVVWTLHDMWALTGHCVHSFECEKWQTGCDVCPDIKITQPLLWDNSRHLWQAKKRIYQNSKLNIVVPSQWLKDKVEKSILNTQNISLIYNGVDTEIFKPTNKEQARRDLNLPLDKKIVLFVAAGGLRNYWKGTRFVEQAIKHFATDEKIIFVCLGGERTESSGSVKFVSYADAESQLVKYYGAADAFLFTSLAENFPLVVLEAMACGLPIVSFDVGGVKEALLHRENGYLAKYKDFADLIVGFNYILNLSEAEKRTMAAKSIERVRENFSLKIMVQKYIDLYSKLLRYE